MAGPSEGVTAPDFDLATDGGGRIRLADLKGKKVVLYFYPKDDTKGCTIEAIDFTALLGDFDKAGAIVVGVSPDTVESHDRFKQKHGLSLALAADPEHKAIDAYGLWIEKSLYGRKYMGVDRSTFLIGPDGRIARTWRSVRVKGHAEEVLAAAKRL
ncbi:MAG: peroxiredoxin [Bauldia sp.]|nr:MAG: peroxiredoxin [Bauldia sp.]MBZ0230466.1 peroxiredoxin [Bauldia sp.]